MCRPVQRDTAQQLESALAVADGASEYLSQLTRVAADNAAAEIQAGDALQVKYALSASNLAPAACQRLQLVKRLVKTLY